MSFKKYLLRNYGRACNEQRLITLDAVMLENLQSQCPDWKVVERWMTSYGLFRGCRTNSREVIAKVFLHHVSHLNHDNRNPGLHAEVKTVFKDLLTTLYDTVERGWMSATSKLLWSVYPFDFVIYDAFVHRALVVLQNIDSDLTSFKNVGNAPKIKSRFDLDAASDFYVGYYNMVKHLQNNYRGILDDLREEHSELYPYDVRIMDKLLWMIGNPGQGHLA